MKLMDYPLIKSLKEYDFDFLIPLNLNISEYDKRDEISDYWNGLSVEERETIYSDGNYSEYWGETDDDGEYIDYDGEYIDCNNNELEEEYDEDDVYIAREERVNDIEGDPALRNDWLKYKAADLRKKNHLNNSTQPDNVFTLIKWFGFNEDIVDADEFLCMDVEDLLGITKPQMKFVDKSLLEDVGLQKFTDVFKDETIASKLPDVEKRIKVSLALAYANYKSVLFSASMIDCHTDLFLNYLIKIASHQTLDRCKELLQLYRDYLNNYRLGQATNSQRPDEDKITYPIFPKVSHIRDLHDKISRDADEERTRIAAENQKALDEGIIIASQNVFYTNLLYKNEKYIVTKPTSYSDFEKEAKELNHCILSYSEAFSKGETYIYFLRKQTESDTPYYSAEVRPIYTTYAQRVNGAPSGYELTQLYGRNNTTYKTKEFTFFCAEWCKAKKIKIICQI